jgi:hypothetical protein
MEVHHPQNIFSIGYFTSLINRGGSLGWLYFLVPLLVPLIRRKKEIWAIRLYIFFLASYAIWNYLGASADRFLSGLVPISIILLILILREFIKDFRIAGYILLVSVLLYSLSYLTFLIPQGSIVFRAPGERYFFNVLGGYAHGVSAANKTVGKDGKLLLIYEARTYPFGCKTAANTVFDKSIVLEIAKECGSGSDMITKLRENGFTHCLVNEFELTRLIKFLREDNIERYLDRPEILVNYREFYPPFDLSGDYEQQERKIERFFEILEDSENISFEIKSINGLRLYIAEL